MKLNRHYIERQSIELQFEDRDMEMSAQDEMRQFVYEQLLPGMDDLFAEISDPTQTVSFSLIEIDCGRLSDRRWREEMVEQVLRELRTKLTVADRRKSKTRHQELLNAFESISFFLEDGLLPWHAHVQTEEQLEELFLEAVATDTDDVERISIRRELVKRLKSLLTSKPQAAKRLIHNFSDAFFECVVRLMSNGGDFDERLDRVTRREISTTRRKGVTSKEAKLARTVLLKTTLTDRALTTEEISLIAKTESQLEAGEDDGTGVKRDYVVVKSARTARDGAEAGEAGKEDDEEGKEEKEGEACYINNSGLVILHPFLPELFKQLELWQDGQWNGEFAQPMAVAVLEFLATGEERPVEFNMAFNKILCGMPIHEVWQPVDEIPERMKIECDELLREVIRHWRVMKNTGVDAFRETFLRREGKLTQVENGWLLRVEQKGVDVLLESLPWGIGTIKLPWAEEKIHVEWT